MSTEDVNAATVKQLAREAGFALCGIAPAEPSEHADHVRRWIASGRHGTMAYLESRLELRLDPRKVLETARSVVCVADYLGPPPEAAAAGRDADAQPAAVPPARPTGHVARYAQFDDYHRIIKKRLHQLADTLKQRAPAANFRACVDTAPLLEREHAARAGLGWVGKNTMLIHPRLGSHLMLGELLTSLDLAADSTEADHCGSCTRCIDACPTQCISPYELDASRCISYLTIEHRDAIDPSHHQAVGENLFGCDICQDVCPYNQPGRVQRLGGSAGVADTPETYGQRPARLDILDVLAWDESARREAFTRSAMKRAKLDQMKRNALLVAANYLGRHDDPALRQRIHAIAEDPDEPPLVRQTARHVLQRLNQPHEHELSE